MIPGSSSRDVITISEEEFVCAEKGGMDRKFSAVSRHDSEATEEGKNLSKVQSKLHQALKKVTASVKKAKVFEAQRIVKRLKGLPSPAPLETVSNLESALQQIRDVENHKMALQVLSSKLGKAKLLPRTSQIHSPDFEEVKARFPLSSLFEATDPLVQALLNTLATSDGQNSRAALVTSRIASNRAIAEEVSRTVQEVSSALDQSRTSSLRQEQTTQAIHKNSKSGVSLNEIRSSETLSKPICPESNQRHSDDAVTKLQNPKMDQHVGKRKRSASLSQESSSSSTTLDVEEKHVAASQLASLPTLRTGFIGGRGLHLGRGSDDEWSDGDAEIDSIDSDAEDRGLDGKQKSTKKNRMGQRARKALYEKKYGRDANHIRLREREGKFNRGGPSSGNITTDSSPFRRSYGAQGDRLQSSNHMALKDRTPRPQQRPSSNNFRNLSSGEEMMEKHPSWIAKQRERERARKVVSGEAVAKKVVFD